MTAHFPSEGDARAVAGLRELAALTSAQVRALEQMRDDAAGRLRDGDRADFLKSRLDPFRRQIVALERGVADPAIRHASTFGNVLAWYNTLAQAFDVDLSWSPLEPTLLDRNRAMRRLADELRGVLVV